MLNAACDSDQENMNDEEYYGNYTFIVIEDNKKKVKQVLKHGNILDVDYNYKEE